MRHIDLMNMNIYHIQLFLAVARTENITAAAREMHITQSMLSKVIKQMENMLGIQLFIHEKNRVKITPAGRVLCEEFTNISKSIEQAVEKAHDAQEVKNIPVAISWLNTVNPSEFIYPSIRSFEEQQSGFTYNVFSGSYDEILASFLAGETDVMFTSLFERPAFDDSRYCCEQIIACPLMAFMLKQNDLAKKETVTFSDLQSQNFVVLSPAVSPNYMKNVIVCNTEQAGYQPRISYYALNSKSIGNNLKGNRDIFIADRYFNDFSAEYLESRVIEKTGSGVILVWRKDARETVRELAETIVEYCRNRYEFSA